jgi:phosphoglycerate dehydrogenase-like enzyme
MTLSVHIGYTPDDDALRQLQGALHDDVHITYGSLPDTTDAIQPNYEMLVAGRPSREFLEASPNLHTLLIPFAGLPATTRETMREYPQIAVHNLHHNAPPTAEMALALLLAAARRLIPSDREFRRHDWTPRYQPYPSVLLTGKTALIAGYGEVGRRVGQVLDALGMTVLGTRRTQTDIANGIYPADALYELLPRADVLVIALPATHETEELISERALSLLPQGAIVVNVGRAAVIDQHALYEALKSGHLHGAGLDVWYHYPPDKASRTDTPPADVPFHELDNVVMSPHRAGGGGNPEIEELRMRALANALNQVAEGGALPHRVNLDAGY